jgi:hypothetical protein
MARICLRHAKLPQTEQAAHTLRRMTKAYFQEAAKLDGGKLPESSPTRRQVAAFARPAKPLKAIRHWAPEYLARNDP